MDIELMGGDEIKVPFGITIGSDLVDLTGCTVSAKISTNPVMMLTEGNGITVTDRQGANGSHGFFVLNEAATLRIGVGRSTRVRLSVMKDGVTTSTLDRYFKRLD